mgnify:CR=1 FL=1
MVEVADINNAYGNPVAELAGLTAILQFQMMASILMLRVLWV